MVNFRKLAVVSAVVFFALLVVALIAVPLAFRSYLHSDAFRLKIGDAAGHALKADAEFMPPHLSGTSAYTDGFTARGNEACAFQSLRADQIRADFNWRGLLHRSWQIDELAVERLDVQLAERRTQQEKVNTEPTGERHDSSGRPWTLDLRKATVREARLRWGGGATPVGELAGTALDVKPAEGSQKGWLIELHGGKLRQSGWAEIAVEQAHLHYGNQVLHVRDSLLRQNGGTARVSGEVAVGQSLALNVDYDSLDIAPYLSSDWRARVSGRISGEATVEAPLGGGDRDALTVSGHMRVTGGQITALPVLDQIATFTRTQRFRTLALSTASLEFKREPTRFTGRKMIAEAEGLLRVEGDFTVADGQLDGTFQVGVTAASLQWLPGSQSRVFVTARDGYYWAPMRLTGPVEHPTEDLTPRLVQAAAGEVIDTAEGALKGATRAVKDTAKDLLDRLLR